MVLVRKNAIFLVIITTVMSMSSSTQDIPPSNESSEILARWHQRWSEGNIGWHLKAPHHFLLQHGSYLVPHFAAPASVPVSAQEEGQQEVTCAAEATASAEAVKLFVPLCGKTVDMAFLAHHPGVKEVVGVDGIHEALVEFAQEHGDLEIQQVESIPAFDKYKGKKITLLKGNFFDMDKEEVALGGTFDGILDRASMVAIDPKLRESYVKIMGKLLKPGGSILLITFDRRSGTPEGRSAGPPFSVDEEEVKRLYGDLDWVESITKLGERDELVDEASKAKWTQQGVNGLWELVFVIRAKGTFVV